MPPNAIRPGPAVVLSLLTLMIFLGIVAAWTQILIARASDVPILPNIPRRRVPWGIFSVLGVIFLYLGVQFAAMFGYGAYHFWLAPGVRMARGDMPLPHQIGLVALCNFVVVLIIPALLRLTSGARLRDLGVVGENLGVNVGRGIVGCLAMLPLVYGVLAGAQAIWHRTPHPVELALLKNPSLAITVLMFLAAVVAAPVAEELLFRAVLLGWLWRIAGRTRRSLPDNIGVDAFDDHTNPYAVPDAKVSDDNPYSLAISSESHAPPAGADAPRDGRGALLANIGASLVFAGLHYSQWPSPIPLFFLSMAMGYLYQRTGSLVAPIALHATFNGLSTTAMFLYAWGQGKPG